MSQIKRATRVPFNEEVRYSNGGRRFLSRAVNISLSGIFLSTGELQPLDAELDMELELPFDGQRQSLKVRGKVYRAVPAHSDGSLPHGMGVTFIGLDPRSRGFISALVHERLCTPRPPASTSGLDPIHELVPALPWERNLPFVLVAVLLGILAYVTFQVL